MTLRELVDDALYGDAGIIHSHAGGVDLRDDAVDVIVGAVQDWLSQQETADAVYVAQTRTGIGPPLSAITAALVRLAAE